jgi:hypothetical protein
LQAGLNIDIRYFAERSDDHHWQLNKKAGINKITASRHIHPYKKTIHIFEPPVGVEPTT